MFYILYGQDDFSLNQALREIKTELGDPEMLSLNTSDLNAAQIIFPELRTTCDVIPFLSPYRLVIVNGLLGKYEKKQGKSRSGKGTAKSSSKLGEWDDLASYVKQMPDTTILVLVDGEIKGQNSLLKKLAPLAEVRAFPLRRGNNLWNWIEQRVEAEDGNITPEAVSLLAELIGGDLWTMNNEIQKLVLYCQERAVSEDDVRQMVGYAQETSIFPLVDAIAEGKTELAQRVLYHLYQEGASPIYILTMITRQYRLIAQVKDLKPGLPYQQIQDRLGLKSSYSLDKVLVQAKRYTFDSVKQAYSKLLETDLAIKTGRCNDKLAIELLIAELS